MPPPLGSLQDVTASVELTNLPWSGFQRVRSRVAASEPGVKGSREAETYGSRSMVQLMLRSLGSLQDVTASLTVVGPLEDEVEGSCVGAWYQGRAESGKLKVPQPGL